jgi:tripartite-type tricarboxylate transporter receptor subunit TctC
MMIQLSALLSICLLALQSPVFAQAYPVKPVRMIVPFPAGGAVDGTARAFAQKFSEVFGQQFIVDNRSGAGGNIGADLVAKAAPDGYTLLITTPGHAIAPSLYRKLPFDVIRDFVPVSQMTQTFLLLVSNTALPVRSARDLVTLARSQPGKLNYGHTGIGVAPHLVGEMLRIAAGIDVVAVPYKGDAPLIPALIAGEVQYGFVPGAVSNEHVRAGRLRAVAVSGGARAATYPDTPTLLENNLDVEYLGWTGMFATGGTSREIVGRLSSEIAAALKTPEIAARVRNSGYEPGGTSPEQFAAKFQADIARYAKVIREARIPLMD